MSFIFYISKNVGGFKEGKRSFFEDGWVYQKKVELRVSFILFIFIELKSIRFPSANIKSFLICNE